jgi:hypothetical protein
MQTLASHRRSFIGKAIASLVGLVAGRLAKSRKTSQPEPLRATWPSLHDRAPMTFNRSDVGNVYSYTAEDRPFSGHYTIVSVEPDAGHLPA